MKKNRLLATILTSLLLVSVVGCNKPSGDSGTKDSSLPSIGATIYKYDDNFMSYVRRTIENECKDKATIIMNDSQNDQSKQIEQIDTMLAKGVKVLAINLVDPKAAPTVIEKAKAANVPVIFFNKEPEASALKTYDKAWYVGTESKESGVIQGKMMVEEWNKNKDKWDKNKDGKIQYVLLKGEPGHPDAEARTKYSIEEFKNANIQTEELAMDTAMWDAAKATEKMDAWLAKHGDNIELVICNNDGMALGALASLEKSGYFKNDKMMPLFGVDAIPEVLDNIKAGKIVGTVLNDAKNQGKATVELSINAANGKDPVAGTNWKLDDKKAVRVPYIGINKDNIKVGEDAYK